jgi:hypothetical protein
MLLESLANTQQMTWGAIALDLGCTAAEASAKWRVRGPVGSACVI